MNLSSSSSFFSLRTTTLLAAALATPTLFAPAAADAALFDYNLVVTNTLTTESEVEGRTFVGSLRATNAVQFGTRALATGGNNAIDTLSVATAFVPNQNSSTLNIERGTFRHTPALPGNLNVNLNNGSIRTQTPLASEFSALTSELAAVSALYAGLTPNSTFSTAGQNLSFTPVYNADGRAIVSLPASTLNIQNLNINSLPVVPAGNVLIINVTNIPGTIDWNLNNNALATSGINVVWNFPTTTDFNLNLNRRFVGAILGPNLQLSNITAIEGGVYVENFNQRGEVHHPLSLSETSPRLLISNPIPEPAALGALAPAAALLMRRRRAAR